MLPGINAAPDRTWAVVVGIDHYGLGSNFNLVGPRCSARHFARWLLDIGVPPDQLALFESPLLDVAASAAQTSTSNAPPALLGVTARGASADAIYHAIMSGVPGAVRGQLLIIFWAGHGIITPDLVRRLLCCDAQPDNRRNLNVDSLRRFLRSNVGPGFPHTAIFIDACADYVRAGDTVGWSDRTFPTGTTQSRCRQFVAFAAAPGQQARSDPQAGVGLFTRELMSQLRAPAGEAPRDMHQLAQRLRQAFGTQKAGAEPAQAPTFFECEDWDGSTGFSDGSWSGQPPADAPKLSVGHLPPPADPDLFVGRDHAEGPMDQLRSAWASNTAIVQVVASGGVGKSTVAFHFMEDMRKAGYPGCRSVIDWSFYSQGQHEYQTDSQRYFRLALEHFALFDPALKEAENKPPDQIGRALARVYCRADVGGLVVLDGVEPLQNPRDVSEGRLKDTGLREFLNAVRRAPLPRPGDQKRLVLITTRWTIGELQPTSDGEVRLIDLKILPPEEGAKLLRGVRLRDDPASRKLRSRDAAEGSSEERKEFEGAARDYGGHPLALVLLGSYLLEYKEGYLEERPMDGGLPESSGTDDPHRHARRILRDYTRILEAGTSDRARASLQLLYLLGLWDRPAPLRLVKELLKVPTAAVTDRLVVDSNFQSACDDLRRLRFLSDAPVFDAINTHPIIREHFGDLLRSHYFDAWRQLHDRLFEYLRSDPGVPQQPNRLEQMDVLFQAVVHGCKAGRHQEALDSVLVSRILRDQEYYAIARLGATAAVLSALSHFFEPNNWGDPIHPDSSRQGLTLEGELKVLTLAGVCLTPLKGYAAAETDQCYGDRATRICQLVRNSPELFRMLFGRWRVHLARGETHETLETAVRLKDLAEAIPDEPKLALVASRAMSSSHLWRGELDDAVRWCRAGIEHAAPSLTPIETFLFLNEPRIGCRISYAIARWVQGYPDEARREIDQAVQESRGLGHGHTLAVALYFHSFVSQFRGEVGPTRLVTEELIALATDMGFAFWLSGGQILHGWARARSGEPDLGLVELEDGIKRWENTGARLINPYWRALWAEVSALCARPPKDIIPVLVGTLEDGARREERWWLPDLSRQLGLATCAAGDIDAGRAGLSTALDQARQLGAKSLELRILSDLCDVPGSRRGDCEDLRVCFDAIGEGRSTTDLVRARSLLTASDSRR